MKKEKMNSRERVLAALQREEPDKIPWIEDVVDFGLVQRLMTGKGAAGNQEQSHLQEVVREKTISDFLGRDNICLNMNPPEFCDKVLGSDGIWYYGQGHIRTESDLEKMDLPDPDADNFYHKAEAFVQQKGDFAACAGSRLGIASTYLSMGMENFFIQLIENPEFVLKVFKTYAEWLKIELRRLCEIGFDFLWICDDIAYKTGPMFSPSMYRDLFLPHLMEIAETITIPWLYHSDGNMLPFMEDWLSLGQSAINPIEPQAMDILKVKELFGDRVCVVGNIDVDLLAQGSPQEVVSEVREKLQKLAPGGGYIFASGNSIPSYVKPENLLAMSETFNQYRDLSSL